MPAWWRVSAPAPASVASPAALRGSGHVRRRHVVPPSPMTRPHSAHTKVSRQADSPPSSSRRPARSPGTATSSSSVGPCRKASHNRERPVRALRRSPAVPVRRDPCRAATIAYHSSYEVSQCQRRPLPGVQAVPGARRRRGAVAVDNRLWRLPSHIGHRRHLWPCSSAAPAALRRAGYFRRPYLRRRPAAPCTAPSTPVLSTLHFIERG